MQKYTWFIDNKSISAFQANILLAFQKNKC